MKKRMIIFALVILTLVSVFSSCALNQPSQIIGTEQKGDVLTMEHIWKIEDPTDFVVALSQYIAEKCQYGDDMTVLSEPERVFYIAQELEAEVNNGGFSQFFYNSSGDFSNELVSVFSEIGAQATAAICQKAIAAFGCDIPADRDEREELLDDMESDVFDEILNECDNAFYNYEDDLTALNYEYVIKNKESFT